MASKQKRTVQTCSLCEKTGHNKRRCSLATKKPTKKQIVNPSAPQTKTSTPVKKSAPATAVSSPKKKVQIKHYVPVMVGKKVSLSEHIVDLSDQAHGQGGPSWDAIQSFREELAQTVERRTVDFAASIRASKHISAQAQKKHKKTVRPRRMKIPRISLPSLPTLSLPRFRLPQISFPRVRFSVPHIRVPQLPAVHLPQMTLPQFSFRRALPAMLALLVLLSVPMPALSAYRSIRDQSAYMVSVSTDAFVSLQESTTAAFQADTQTAQTSLQDALSEFAQVETFLNTDHPVLTNVMSALPFVGEHVTSRRAMLTAGQHIALGNTYVIKGVSEAQADGDTSMTDRLQILTVHMEQALPQYKEAQRALVSVNPTILPPDQRPLYEEFLVLYSTFLDDVQDLVDLSHVLYGVFGGDTFQRYLVLFQNNNEIRATGGFIGSFAILDTQKGRIEHIDIPAGGSYDIQGQLDTYRIPPIPLQLVNNRWEFQDINWFFDFPTTARKAESYVTAARGMSFDGTIAINASVIERVLRVIGPVKAGEYDLLLDADSVLPALQHHVEVGYKNAGDTAPKEILTNVLAELLGAMQTIEPDQLFLLLRELHEALGEKEIQIALHNAPTQARLATFGWTGAVVKTQPRQDYLAVVATNVQGQKSDARIDQHIDHTVGVQDDGSVIVRVDITRTHRGDTESLYNAPNIAYLRTYVPEGSVLLDAGGFTYPPEDAFRAPESWYTEDPDLARIEQEVGTHRDTGTRITNEFGKTAFGNWMVVNPGTAEHIWFTYRLPFSVVDKKRTTTGLAQYISSQPDAVSRYSLFVQKQSGTTSSLMSTVQYPDSWMPRWKSLDSILLSPHGAQIETVLDTDMVYGIVLEERH